MTAFSFWSDGAVRKENLIYFICECLTKLSSDLYGNKITKQGFNAAVETQSLHVLLLTPSEETTHVHIN